MLPLRIRDYSYAPLHPFTPNASFPRTQTQSGELGRNTNNASHHPLLIPAAMNANAASMNSTGMSSPISPTYTTFSVPSPYSTSSGSSVTSSFPPNDTTSGSPPPVFARDGMSADMGLDVHGTGSYYPNAPSIPPPTPAHHERLFHAGDGMAAFRGEEQPYNYHYSELVAGWSPETKKVSLGGGYSALSASSQHHFRQPQQQVQETQPLYLSTPASSQPQQTQSQPQYTNTTASSVSTMNTCRVRLPQPPLTRAQGQPQQFAQQQQHMDRLRQAHTHQQRQPQTPSPILQLEIDTSPWHPPNPNPLPHFSNLSPQAQMRIKQEEDSSSLLGAYVGFEQRRPHNIFDLSAGSPVHAAVTGPGGRRQSLGLEGAYAGQQQQQLYSYPSPSPSPSPQQHLQQQQQHAQAQSQTHAQVYQHVQQQEYQQQARETQQYLSQSQHQIQIQQQSQPQPQSTFRHLDDLRVQHPHQVQQSTRFSVHPSEISPCESDQSESFAAGAGYAVTGTYGGFVEQLQLEGDNTDGWLGQDDGIAKDAWSAGGGLSIGVTMDAGMEMVGGDMEELDDMDAEGEDDVGDAEGEDDGQYEMMGSNAGHEEHPPSDADDGEAELLDSDEPSEDESDDGDDPEYAPNSRSNHATANRPRRRTNAGAGSRPSPPSSRAPRTTRARRNTTSATSPRVAALPAFYPGSYMSLNSEDGAGRTSRSRRRRSNTATGRSERYHPYAGGASAPYYDHRYEEHHGSPDLHYAYTDMQLPDDHDDDDGGRSPASSLSSSHSQHLFTLPPALSHSHSSHSNNGNNNHTSTSTNAKASGRKRTRQAPGTSLPVPVPVPHLTKKSRGRRVPTVLDPPSFVPSTSAPSSSGARLGVSSSDSTSFPASISTPVDAAGATTASGRPRRTASAAASPSGSDAGAASGSGKGKGKKGASGQKAVRTYKCVVAGCEKLFARGEHLKRHIRSIHTYEKPHKCPAPGCGKDFSRYDNLGQHLRVHKDYVPVKGGASPAGYRS